MTDCGCDRARADLEEYLRNEICKTEQSDIREHIDGCEGCQSEALVARTLTDAVQRACKEAAPEDVRRKVLASIRAAQAAHIHS
ncbi:zf-HC2 domain-containing protein [Microbacterium halotolerans]|uniref:zf-HC2 domain-containing protein n=1 Tax=Microbacterium halotolerans TaxID=246613 RepID=UPI000E6AC43E|nr:zf-HC2 domain-containing protein [Microbacterium halotolerans]